ncbi:MAG TPA: hypothetical protein VK783_16415 [Bacteroidia bacterium]|jgi:hypothetical protein|nr:hypothetical protein [Bacteroidia bacterium]
MKKTKRELENQMELVMFLLNDNRIICTTEILLGITEDGVDAIENYAGAEITHVTIELLNESIGLMVTAKELYPDKIDRQLAIERLVLEFFDKL